MPALNTPDVLRLTTRNGLTLTVRHVPRLTRSAACIRVAVGSHDVPADWPGLAHFLEHLLFLGTERFPAAQGLMAYVQQHGGHLNARTSERHTDFFFELPPEAFAGGLDRLCDMLAHPRLDPDDQRREREVLHAEFIAWAREPSAQRDLQRLQPLNATHPLRGFHAGNRYSLPVPRAAFQRALTHFHEQFYRTGHMTLSLVGPQSQDTLIALAERYSLELQPGTAATPQPPPPLMSKGSSQYLQVEGSHVDLMFTLEQLPTASEEALAFLCHWINADKPGGLLAHLRQQQLTDSLRATSVYQFQDQALLGLTFTGSTDMRAKAQPIRDAVDDWLCFFSAQQPWTGLRNEYRRVQERQQQVSSALELARRDVQHLPTGLSDHGVEALAVILKHLQTEPRPSGQHAWQLPTPNPFLISEKHPVTAGLIRGQTSAHRGLRTFAQDRLRSRREVSAMTFSPALAPPNGEAAVYLRWHLGVTPAPSLLPALQHRLLTLQHDAREAGVEMSLIAQGNDWLLKLHGLQEPMPAILEHALPLLTPLTDDAPGATPQTPLMPIRQLLKRLPELHSRFALPAADSVQHVWPSARWHGLAVGVSPASQPMISSALSKAPGTPDPHLTHIVEAPSARHWHTAPCESSEQALLLFCPAPRADLTQEAAWRLLAHLAQTPFYQRLRVELQMGYAVFSGVRQLGDRTGLLLGVQSPQATTADIFEQVRTFLGQLPQQIAALDEASFIEARTALAQQFSAEALSLAQAADLLWHAQQAGHSSDYLKVLYNALMTLDRATTLKAAECLNDPDSDWLCVATEPQTESFYQRRS
ncbi:pyrroloquinoline quinone biosynthesis protein PqqF [Pseudomonas lundensis]|uniref:pyrroloquinoline quinone biosynthesis protein PqqF n=1 Tax=Pseudomonas lundensis TaxID=86185 RepID=UPI000652F1A5|nr:pyrroloquinoline quinone biosynthesis protein PqqF [Pseudomonas lundensis]KMM87240.1 pyrroloquinoline quinone biosynthesis protein PqqF [Pseudomonas lundensis]